VPRFRFLAPFLDLLPYPNEEALRAALAPAAGGTLVSIGGGTGRVARRVADDFEATLLVDLQPATLARAPPGLERVVADAGELPLATGSVDAVVAVDAFHHFQDPEAVLAEARRVLTTQGSLVIEEFDPDHWMTTAIVASERVARFGSTFYYPGQLRDVVDAAGFPDPDVVRFSERDYAVVADAPEGKAPKGSPSGRKR
jgi:demethylmenaquinone methyltransferase/2-methoxy-6-polyprenyl-1,4-benzoquinol methylase